MRDLDPIVLTLIGGIALFGYAFWIFLGNTIQSIWGAMYALVGGAAIFTGLVVLEIILYAPIPGPFAFDYSLIGYFASGFCFFFAGLNFLTMRSSEKDFKRGL